MSERLGTDAGWNPRPAEESTRSPLVSSSMPVAASVLVLISSACCIGPLAVVLSFVGLSSGTMLAVENVVGPFRPVILGVTVLPRSGEHRENLTIGFDDVHPDGTSADLILAWAETTVSIALEEAW